MTGRHSLQVFKGDLALVFGFVIKESLSSNICTIAPVWQGRRAETKEEEGDLLGGWMQDAGRLVRRRPSSVVLGCLYPSEIQFLIYHGQRPRCCGSRRGALCTLGSHYTRARFYGPRLKGLLPYKVNFY